MVRLIAFYLPQFHPIPENDEWWGKGFTEWRNVVQAKPLFPGHYQPHLPADLGFYDLRVPETRQAQADLAREYSIHGFCYYHYWFKGRRLLERPFNEVLASGQPDFPFCLCWANESWTRAWDGHSGNILIHQEYSDEDDYDHGKWLIDVFQDPRYIRFDGKPVFLIYRATSLPNPFKTLTTWREMARRAGIGEIFFCRVESNFEGERGDPTQLGFDAAVEFQPDALCLGKPLQRGIGWEILRLLGFSSKAYRLHNIYDYATIVHNALAKNSPAYLRFPCVTPMWDSSARRKRNAHILHGSTPVLYEKWLREIIRRSNSVENNLIFINAWNEWAEGNHLEPDLRYGKAYLEATQRAALE
jgi:lipopolysaccharide biosynthesis protein